MYLSRIDLNLSDPRVRNALRDAQQMHRLLTGLFNMSRSDNDLLYRCRIIGGHVSVYMYSNTAILRDRILSCMQLRGERDLSDWVEGMQEGQIFAFNTLTMPFKKVEESNNKNSRRRVLRTIEERYQWFEKKAKQNGFALLNVDESESEKIRVLHGTEKGGRMTMDTYCYWGMLKITDPVLFRKAICHGIGAGRSYGLGMLLLKGQG